MGSAYGSRGISVNEFLMAPRVFTKKRKASLIPENVIVASLAAFGAEKEITEVHKRDYKRFVSAYAANRLWQIEAGRAVMESLNATGAIIAPHLPPFGNLERRSAMSETRGKFALLQGAIAEHHKLDAEIDISPLLILLLDGASEPAMIPETLCLLRRDYAELRNRSTQFDAEVKAAETYADKLDTTRRWEAD